MSEDKNMMNNDQLMQHMGYPILPAAVPPQPEENPDGSHADRDHRKPQRMHKLYRHIGLTSRARRTPARSRGTYAAHGRFRQQDDQEQHQQDPGQVSALFVPCPARG